MTPAETAVFTALSVADEQAALRIEIHNMIIEIVQAEVSRIMMEPGFIATLGINAFSSRTFEMEKIALRAVKNHFNNPQMIY